MDHTHAINLPQDFPTRYTNQSAPVRKARKAQKAGVTITTASTLEAWQEYYQVYQSSLERWGEKTISQHSWEFFAEIFRRNSPNVKLWLARYQDRIASGALCFYSKQQVVYWHGAGLAEFFHVRPVNLLMYTLMKDSYERGYTWLDFYPSGGMEGVIAFKESLGASPLPAPIAHIKPPRQPWQQLFSRRVGNKDAVLA
jgi:lipid II:glycine glycyltransferase (peptidoglycan interpeptide bridge formation enzyme)